jgi:drug/metabolite transporter (DMT)-like permease
MLARIPSLAPLLAVLIWSGNLVAAKVSVQNISPGAMAFYRSLVPVVVLTPFLIKSIWQIRHHLSGDWLKLASLGFLGVTCYQGILYTAAEKTSATNLGIITATIPLLTVVLSRILLNERPSLPFVFGFLLSLSGVIILIEKGRPEALFTQSFNFGDVLIIIASGIYALYGVLLQRWNLGLPLWKSLYLQSLFGMFFLVPFYLKGPPSPLNYDNLIGVLYAGVPASTFAPYLWMTGVRLIGSNRTSSFMNLLPVLTAIIAIVILRESICTYHITGGAITICGVMIGHKWSVIKNDHYSSPSTVTSA